MNLLPKEIEVIPEKWKDQFLDEGRWKRLDEPKMQLVQEAAEEISS
jgi:hypothetical protein